MKLIRIIIPAVFALVMAGGSLLVALPQNAYADSVDLYWYGGTGNWGDGTSHWSTNSGNSPSSTHATPTSTNKVIFDANSFTGAGQKVTINVSASCADMDWSSASNTPELAGTQSLSIYGSLTMTSSMIVSDVGTITFASTAAGKTVETSGRTMTMPITFNGAGGGWTLSSNLTLNTGALTLTAGTLDTANKTISGVGTFSISGSSTRSITLGSSTINATSWNAATTTALTFNVGTSSINLNANSPNFQGGGLTYNNVTINQTSVGGNNLTGSNTFANLTLQTGGVANSMVTPAGNQTITGTLTLTGNSASYPMYLFSDTLHTQRTFTAATVTTSNVIFRDIIGAGVGSWNFSVRTDMGNAGGNSGITFPAGINVYASQIPGNVNWSNTLNWASTHNGAPGSGRIPLPQDVAIFDDTSIAVPGITVTLDQLNLSGFNTLNITNNPLFTASAQIAFYNSVNLGSCTLTITSGVVMLGQTAQTLSGAFGNNAVELDPQGGSFSLSNAFSTNYKFTITSGIFNANNYSVGAGEVVSSVTTYNRGIVLGSSLVTLTYNSTSGATVWNVNATNLSLTAGTSTIVVTSTAATGLTFTPGTSLTYYDLQVRGSGSYALTFSAATTFHDVTIIRSNDSQTSAAAKTITGNFQLTITHLYSPLYGTTVTSIGTTDWAKTAGLVALDYLAFTGGANTSVATGGATPFLAGSHSTGSPQTGWSFTDATAPTISAQAATLTTRTTAVLNGSLDSLGSYTTEGAYIYFQYDLTGAYTAPTETTPTLYTSVGIKSAGIGSPTPLVANTTYHFRVVCSYNGGQLLYGDDTTFLTLGAPVALTQDPTGKTGTGATLQGLLVDLGDYSDVFASFQYGATTSYGSITAPETHMNALGAFSSTIGGLTAGATYHYRAVLRYNATQYAYGADVSFVSNSTQSAPVMSTLNPSGITTTSAVLQGMLVSVGDYPFVLVSFQWGLTTGYGTETTAESFTTPSTYHTGITGLAVGKTYHYRAKGQYNNNTQTVYGSDVSFVAQVQVPVGGSNNSGLMPDHPSDPGLYNEGGTTFLGYALLLALANGWGIPIDMLIMFWCFGWALVLGLVAYRLTMGATNKYQKAGALALRPGSLFVQALVSLVVMIYFTFAGGGVIPSWVLIPFAVEAITAIIVRQNGGQVLGG